MDLSEFLLARIGEDEEVARAATQGPWAYEEHKDRDIPSMWSVDGPIPPGEKYPANVVDVDYDRDYGSPQGGCVLEEDAAHIARWDSARVLAECQAKRRIVEECTSPDSERVKVRQGVYENRPVRHIRTDDLDIAEGVLRILALPYADHADYRSEWAVQ